MAEYFVVLAPAASPDDVRAWLAAAGGRPVQAYGDRALVVELAEGGVAASTATPESVRIYEGPVPEDLGGLDEVARMGVQAWNLRQSSAFQRSRRTRIGEGRSWGDEDAEPEG
jgi:hypothetical protein